MPLSKERMRERKRRDRLNLSPEARLKAVEYSREYIVNRKLLPKGYIYFILDEESDAVKIGIADNPNSRLLDLQTGNPHKLKLMKVIENGTMAQELELQERFANLKLKGEWFSFSREPMSNLNTHSVVQPKQETKKELRGLIGSLESKSNLLKSEVRYNPPLYNPTIHKAGDRVRMFDGDKMIEVVVPDLDADSGSIPSGAMSQSFSLVGNRLFTPAFRPVAKPLPKVKRRKW